MGDLIDLAKYKRQRNVEGRKTLYVSHLTGKITRTPGSENRTESTREKIARIKELLEYLKQINAEKQDVDDRT